MATGISLQTLNPTFLKEWDDKKNSPVTTSDVTKGSSKKAWWVCSKGHSYEAKISSRTSNNTGCPFCAGKRVLKQESLLKRFPRIAKEWDYNKNEGARPEHYLPKSNKKCWWKCPQGHSYNSVIAGRTAGRGCPDCQQGKNYLINRRDASKNSLKKLYPEIAKEWDFKKNGDLKPSDVLKRSSKMVWWLCPQGHSYECKIFLRTARGDGCPYCSGRRICKDNSLATSRPDIAKKWHPTKNGSLTPRDVTKSSNKDVWWRCPNGHSYKKTINQICRLKNINYCVKCNQ